MAVQPWAHNAFLTQDPPTKEWLLYHIGTGVAPASGWTPCVVPNITKEEPVPVVAPPCPGRVGNLAIRSSSSLLGPWTPLSTDPCSVDGGVNISYTQPWSKFVAGNPAPFIFENGTVLFYYSAQPCPAGWGKTGTCINVMRGDSWKGPYTPVSSLPIGGPTESEDPSVFRDARGHFHLLTNVNNGHARCDPSVPCGGHAWSKVLLAAHQTSLFNWLVLWCLIWTILCTSTSLPLKRYCLVAHTLLCALACRPHYYCHRCRHHHHHHNSSPPPLTFVRLLACTHGLHRASAGRFDVEQPDDRSVWTQPESCQRLSLGECVH
jgi:hypothetical protein